MASGVAASLDEALHKEPADAFAMMCRRNVDGGFIRVLIRSSLFPRVGIAVAYDVSCIFAYEIWV